MMDRFLSPRRERLIRLGMLLLPVVPCVFFCVLRVRAGAALDPAYRRTYVLLTLGAAAAAVLAWVLVWRLTLARGRAGGADASPQRVFLAAFLPLGLAYMLLMPPLFPPDEHVHGLRAAVTVQSLFSGGEAKLDERVTLFFNQANDPVYRNRYPVATGHLFTGRAGVPVPATPSLRFYNISYAPQYVAALAGQLLGLDGAATLYLMRACNLLLYAAAIFFAIRLIPRYKQVLLCCALIPMATHQAASASYDAYAISMAFLLIALFFRAIDAKGRMTARECVALLLAGALTVPAKVVYLPLLLLAFFIPAERFGSRGRKAGGVIVLLFVCGLSVLLNNITILTQIATGNTAWDASGLNWAGEINYAVSDVLRSPLHFVKVYVHTLAEMWPFYLFSCYGGLLGALDVPISRVPIYFFMVLPLLAAWLAEKRMPGKGLRLACAAVVLISAAMSMFSMLVTWTGNTRMVILGVQGRYFLPVLPLAYIALKPRAPQRAMWPTGPVLAVVVCMHVWVLFDMLNGIFWAA